MDWLTAGSDDAAANIGWAIGALAGFIIDSAVVLALVRAPRLRERGGQLVQVPSAWARRQRLAAGAVAVLWLLGLPSIGHEHLRDYTAGSLFAAAITVGVLMFVLFPLAASQIARRSVW